MTNLLGGSAAVGRGHVAPRRAIVVGALLLALVAFGLGLLDVRRRAPNSDFTVFTIAGAAFFDGRDPYEIANPQGWHYAYPPLFALLVSPLAGLSFRGQVVAWYTISVGFGILCVLECRRIARAIRRDEPAADAAPLPRWMILAAALSPLLPAIDTLQRGQVALAITWPLLLGLRLAIDCRRPGGAWLAGGVLALPIAIKLTPLVPVGLLALIGLRRSTAGHEAVATDRRRLALIGGVAIGLALFLLALPATLLGWEKNVDHLSTWARRIEASARVGVDDNKYTFRNQSFANAVEMLARWEHPKSPLRWLSPRDPAIRDLRLQPRVPRSLLSAAVPAILLALSGLVIASGWRIGGRGRPLGTAAAFGLAAALSLVISPISWAHHFAILLPAVLFVPWWFHSRRRPATAACLAVAPPVLLGIHYLLIDTGWIELPFGLALVWVVGLLGVGTAVWCGAASVLMLLVPCEPEEQARLIPPKAG